jgi:hypothetical protein
MDNALAVSNILFRLPQSGLKQRKTMSSIDNMTTSTIHLRETQTDENVGDRIRGQGNYCPTYLDMVDRHTMKGKEKRRTEYRDLV